MQSVSLPSSVSSIGESAFEECTALAEVTCLSLEPPTMGRFVFDGVSGSATLKVFASSLSKYKAAAQWSSFGTIEATDAVSADATLRSLTVAWGALSQTFGQPVSLTPDTLYVSPRTESVTLTATQTYVQATVDGTGEQPLNEGVNAFPVTVTAEDKTTTQTYTVVVIRTENTAPLHAKIEALEKDTARLNAENNTLSSDNTTLTTANSSLQQQLTECESSGGSTKPTAVSSAQQSSVKIYPNPVVNEQLTVDNEQWEASETVEVYSMSGTLVTSCKTTGKVTGINVSHLPNGTYLLKVGRYAGKFVKQ